MKQLISIILSLLLLASSSGIAYAQHFCGDFEMLATVTFGEEKLSCGMVMVKDDACEDEKEEEHGCCDNQYTQVITDDNFSSSNFDFQLPQNFVVAFVSVFVVKTNVESTATNTKYTYYNPPPLIKDIPVLFETFLI